VLITERELAGRDWFKKPTTPAAARSREKETRMKDEKERARERQRTTIDDARQQGTGEVEDGIDPVVPSYTDPGGVSDLGADEPVVPKDRQGKPSETSPGQSSRS
jgi:hypothetical protein